MTERTTLIRFLVRDGASHLFGAFWGSLVAVDAVTATRAPGWVGTAAVAGVVAVSGVRQRRLLALLAAGIGWLFVNGFVENSLGQLRWHGASDVDVLLLLAGIASLVSGRRDLDAILMPSAGNREAARVRSWGSRGRRLQGEV